ncbi:glycosyltransferase family 2 protein [Hyphomicrobium facile]|uniref:Glycosyltransferase involved in cell wall bisynthesis n=1 Tax=Hyphomicrobium facile TaxID=51670 RepID=A0A1I7NDD0_9HYPH|nr:glycosyltransferase family 2 protein [Hyphomicrobium facile]SFV32695.1 Glycosyltransferase involved in cell wall bisynthesis [Hyphomicrobium facile]
MSILNHITVLILTFNEEANIGRTLEAVKWAKRIVIIDSGSTDKTIDIIRNYPQAEIITRTFDGFAQQCNFGLSKVETVWVLSLDADYELDAALVDEMIGLTPSEDISGFSASFVYRIYGRTLRSALYPPRTILYRRDRAIYRNEGHGHRVVLDGLIGRLNAPVYHDDRKPLARWFASQKRYAELEAHYLLSVPRSALTRIDQIRLMAWPAPVLVFTYTLIFKLCIFDGWAGWLYVLQRTLAETMIALEMVDRRLRCPRKST